MKARKASAVPTPAPSDLEPPTAYVDPTTGKRPMLLATLPGAVLKKSGKRPWRIVGAPGTFTDHPAGAAVDAMEVEHEKLLRSIAHRGVVLPNLRARTAKITVPHAQIASIADRLAAAGKTPRSALCRAILAALRTASHPHEHDAKTIRDSLKASGKWPQKLPG